MGGDGGLSEEGSQGEKTTRKTVGGLEKKEGGGGLLSECLGFKLMRRLSALR